MNLQEWSHPANITDMAEVDFEPLAIENVEWRPPSNDGWLAWSGARLPFLRLGYLAMFKTKEELADATIELGEVAFDNMIAGLDDIATQLRAAADLADTAKARCLIGACVAAGRATHESPKAQNEGHRQ